MNRLLFSVTVGAVTLVVTWFAVYGFVLWLYR